MAIQRFQPKTNVPEIVALQFAQGKDVISGLTHEAEVLFSLVDGRSWYTKPEIAAKVDALELGKGEPFQVTKIAGGFDVQYCAASLPAPATVRQPVPVQRPVPVTNPAPARQSVQTPTDGLVVSQDATPTQQHTALSPHTTGGKIMACLLAAIDAFYEAQTYTNRKGLQVSFSGKDIRAFAITAFINDCKEGR